MLFPYSASICSLRDVLHLAADNDENDNDKKNDDRQHTNFDQIRSLEPLTMK